MTSMISCRIFYERNSMKKPLDIQTISTLVGYHPDTGRLYLLKNNRTLLPDETGSITVYDPASKAKRKFKVATLAWVLLNKKELPEEHRILHRNLNTADYSADNLWAIPKEVYKEVTEYVRNINGELRVEQHVNDMLKTVVLYRKDSILRRETFEDHEKARERYYELLKEYTKKINKYLRTV